MGKEDLKRAAINNSELALPSWHRLSALSPVHVRPERIFSFNHIIPRRIEFSFFLRWIARHANSECGNVPLRHNNRRLYNLRWIRNCGFVSSTYDQYMSIEHFCHLNYWRVGIKWSNRVVIIIWHLCRGRLQKGFPLKSFQMIELFLLWCLGTFIQDFPVGCGKFPHPL